MSSDLPMIKTAGGYTFDTTLLNVGDVVVIQCDQWPHNYIGLDFKQLYQMWGIFSKDVYTASVSFKPNQGWQISANKEPRLVVFKGQTLVTDLVATNQEANTSPSNPQSQSSTKSEGE